MKRLFFAMATFIAIGLNAQTEVDFLNAVGEKKLSNIESYMAATVSFCLDDNQKKISKSSAVGELKSFLNGKKVEKFKILHNGQSSDNASSYRVARLKTQQGTYRIFAYSEGKGASSKVIEIRIDTL